MREVQARLGEDIQLGRRGENLAVCVTFDVGDWPGATAGTVQLIHQRNGDDHPYPCAITVENGVATWVITEADVAVAGRGRAELQYLKGETCIKSAIYTTNTLRALGRAGAAPPEPEEGWVSKVLEAGGSALASVEAAQRSEVNAKQSETNAKASEAAARDAQAAAEKARDETITMVGENYASIRYVNEKASTAESNARAYTDTAISKIPTPDVSGQINTHNSSTSAHADIRKAVTAAEASAKNSSLPRDGSAAMTGSLTVQANNAAVLIKDTKAGGGETRIGSSEKIAYIHAFDVMGDATNRRQISIYSASATADFADAVRVLEVKDGKVITGHSMLHGGNYDKYALRADGKGKMTVTGNDGLNIHNTDNGVYGFFRVAANGNVTLGYNPYGDGATASSLTIINQKNADLVGRLKMTETVNGTPSYYDVLHTGNVTAGTTDLTASSSALATGAIYQVYE